MGKICIVSGGMLPVPDVNGGAVEYLATELFRKLQSEQRHEVHVITIDAKNMEKDPCIHVVKTPAALGVLDRMVFFFGDRIKKDWRAMFYRRKYSTRYYKKQVAEILHRMDADLVIVENNMSLLPAVCRGMGAQAFHKHCIYHAHSVLIDQRSMLPWLRKCAAIVTVSDYVTSAFRKEKGLKDCRIMTVVNGVDIPGFQIPQKEKNRKRFRIKYHLPENAYLYLYSGRISPEKGVRELVEAFTQIQTEETALVFAGASFSGAGGVSSYENEIHRMCKERRLKVFFLGYVPHEKIHEIYGLADCLVIPSIVEEAGPLAALEGAASGLPIIAPSKGAVREYLGERAVYYDIAEGTGSELKNKMQYVRSSNLKNDPDREFVSRFSIHSYTKRIMDTVEPMIRRHCERQNLQNENNESEKDRMDRSRNIVFQ